MSLLVRPTNQFVLVFHGLLHNPVSVSIAAILLLYRSRLEHLPVKFGNASEGDLQIDLLESFRDQLRNDAFCLDFV